MKKSACALTTMALMSLILTGCQSFSFTDLEFDNRSSSAGNGYQTIDSFEVTDMSARLIGCRVAARAGAGPGRPGRLGDGTGRNGGIGVHTGGALASAGGRGIFACRDSAAGDAAVERTLAAHLEPSPRSARWISALAGAFAISPSGSTPIR